MTLLTVLAPTVAQQQIPTVWQGSDIRIAVEVAFRSNPLADVLLWEDITEYVRGVQITRGRSGELDRFQPSTAAITVASTGREFDPEYALGTWYGYILPNRAVRVRIQYDAGDGPTEYFVWQGFVDEWPQDYAGISAAEVTIPCSDAFAFLSSKPVETAFTAELATDIASDAAPTAWYRLSEPTGSTTMIDQFGNHGTYTVVPTLEVAALTVGGANTCATFAGDQRGYVSAAATITSKVWAVEALFQQEAYTDDGRLIDSRSVSSGSSTAVVRFRYAQAVDWAAPDYCVQIFTQSTGSGDMYASSYFRFTNLYDGNVHHIVVGMDTGHAPFCYIDGVEITGSHDPDNRAGTGGSDYTYPIDQFYIGNYPSGGVPGGTLDEVVIYDGVNPSAERIAAHATAALTGWAGYTTAEMADAVLDAIGWPAPNRVIGTGATTVSVEELAGTVTDYLMLLAGTEGGQCYVDGQGRIVFRGRTEMANDTRSAVSQAVFGDA